VVVDKNDKGTKMITHPSLQKIRNVFISITAIVLLASTVNNLALAQHHKMPEVPVIKNKLTKSERCLGQSILCAKTVTSLFSPNGDLWRLWAINQQMHFQISTDNGKTFSPAVQVRIPKEKISARNENRPKIAFDKHNGVYLSWASPLEKKYTADVRFSYSADYGHSFSKPITVNNDDLLTGHSFNEMLVTDNGDISIVWLDARWSHELRKQGKKTNGSALYIAKANFRENNTVFSNQQLANNTCVCCRIAMTYNQQEELAFL